MAKGRSGRSGGRKGGKIGGHKPYKPHKKTHTTTHRTTHNTRRNHRTNGVLRVSGTSSSRRNNHWALLIFGVVFSLLAVGELIACLVLGVMVATCVKQPKQDNCPEYDSVMIPLGSTGGIFLIMGISIIILAIRMIIQLKKAAAAASVGEIGLANVSVVQLETGEPIGQQYPMMTPNAVGYYGQPYVQNPIMMNYQYPSNNATFIPNQQPIYYNVQTNFDGSTVDPSFQHYNHSGMPVIMNNHHHSQVNPNIPNQQVDSIPYSTTNYGKPASDEEAIYIPSPQAPQQQIYHDNIV